jgi:hypothetical protein
VPLTVPHLVIRQSIATMRRASAVAGSVSLAGTYRQATATRSAVSVSFALPAAENSRALRFPGSDSSAA